MRRGTELNSSGNISIIFFPCRYVLLEWQTLSSYIWFKPVYLLFIQPLVVVLSVDNYLLACCSVAIRCIPTVSAVYLLLNIAICFYLLPYFVVGCNNMLLSIAFCCPLFSSAAICCHLLLFAVICCMTTEACTRILFNIKISQKEK